MTKNKSEGSGLRKRAVKTNTMKAQVEQVSDSEYQILVMKKLKHSLDEQVNQILRKVEKQIFVLKDQVICQVESIDILNERHVNAFKDKTKTQELRTGDKIGGQFQQKNFQTRDSLLTELFRVPHIRTIYHIFIAFLLNLVISTALQDYVKEGKVTLGFRIIYWNFSDLPQALALWSCLQLFTLLVYCFFHVWGAVRRMAHSSDILVKLWDILFLFLLFTYIIFMLTVPTFIVMKLNFTVALSFALLIEQVRFLMKTHSFIRSCAPKVLSHKKNEAGCIPEDETPTFKKFVYFLFAPTLLYRDSYPRTSQTRWKFVMFHVVEIIGVIFLLAFVYENYILPLMHDFGKSPVSLETLLVIFFGINIPSLLYFLCGFFLLLHCWLNLFSEILRFGDRMFYQDWWNARSFPEYYKKWNVVVHDWLYTYIYKDLTLHVTKNKTISTWMVFLISALFHEFILAFTFRFCYPVLFIIFGFCTTGLYFIPTKFFKAAGNFILWLMLMVGVGFCASMYFMEFFARINCPQTTGSTVLDFFVPKSWTCPLME